MRNAIKYAIKRKYHISLGYTLLKCRVNIQQAMLKSPMGILAREVKNSTWLKFCGVCKPLQNPSTRDITDTLRTRHTISCSVLQVVIGKHNQTTTAIIETPQSCNTILNIPKPLSTY